MAYFAILNGSQVCVGVMERPVMPIGPMFVPLSSLDMSILFHTWTGSAWTPPAPEAVRSMPPRDFLRRFTAAEREALENRLATGTQTVKDKIAAFRTYVLTGGNVELDDDYIIAALASMESAGVIASGRAAQILGGV